MCEMPIWKLSCLIAIYRHMDSHSFCAFFFARQSNSVDLIFIWKFDLCHIRKLLYYKMECRTRVWCWRCEKCNKCIYGRDLLRFLVNFFHIFVQYFSGRKTEFDRFFHVFRTTSNISLIFCLWSLDILSNLRKSPNEEEKKTFGTFF